MAKHQWFESWFDTDYYHLLYGHRDASEAAAFIRTLVHHLSPSPNARFCDLACGNGRHAEVIADMGFEVVGLDLSANNISMARQLENEKLEFRVHDMREPFGTGAFDYVLNLFTSFGYFETDSDHQKTIDNMGSSLKGQGLMVIDYLNSHLVEESLVRQSSEHYNNVDFHIRRLMSETHIVKEIKVIDNNKVHYFEERVRRFDRGDFERMAADAGLKIIETFGDYQLGSFDAHVSPRLIMIASKL